MKILQNLPIFVISTLLSKRRVWIERHLWKGCKVSIKFANLCSRQEQYLSLLSLRIISPDHFRYVCKEIKRIWGLSVKRQHSLRGVQNVKLAYMPSCIRPEVRLPLDQRVLCGCIMASPNGLLGFLYCIVEAR